MDQFMKLFLKPLIRRVGTALSAYLVGAGYAENEATAVATGLVIGLGILLDLLMSAARKA